MYVPSKRNVLLLHGGPALSGYFGPLIPALERDYQVTAYTQTANSLPGLRLELESYIRECILRDGESPIVVGHSFGGVLALLYAASMAKKPKYLPRKIILLDSAPLDLGSKAAFRANLAARITPDVRAKLDALDVAFDATEDEAERTRLQHRNLALITPFYNADRSSTARLSEPTWDYDSFAAISDEFLEMIEAGVIPELLSQIQTPVVSFHGAADPIPVERVLPFLRANLPFFRANTYVGAGHFLWVEPRGIGERFIDDLRAELARP